MFCNSGNNGWRAPMSVRGCTSFSKRLFLFNERRSIEERMNRYVRQCREKISHILEQIRRKPAENSQPLTIDKRGVNVVYQSAATPRRPFLDGINEFNHSPSHEHSSKHSLEFYCNTIVRCLQETIAGEIKWKNTAESLWDTPTGYEYMDTDKKDFVSDQVNPTQYHRDNAEELFG